MSTEAGKEIEEGPKAAVDTSELEALKAKAEALEAELQQDRIERARLEERVNAATKDPGTPEPPPLTEIQMQALVDEGKLTEGEVKTEMERRFRAELDLSTDKKVQTAIATQKQQDVVQTEFDAYIAAFPDVNKPGTADFQRVRNEINSLVKLGVPHTLQSELIAMRKEFGSLDRVEETTNLRREYHQEAGGSGGGQNAADASTATWQKGLTPGQIGAYTDQLQKGIYKGEDDPMFQRVCTRARTQNTEKAA